MSQLTVEATLTHAEVFDDESQVGVHPCEVHQLLLHLVDPLIQLLNLDFTRPNIPLQLLDLVVQHEFELLQLLDLLLQTGDFLLLIMEGFLASLQLHLIQLNRLLFLCNVVHNSRQFFLLCGQLSLRLMLHLLCLVICMLRQCEIFLFAHAFFNFDD